MIRWRTASLIVSLLVTLLPFGPPGGGTATAAGAAGITILQNDVVAAFPRQIDFHVVAESSGQLTSARLAYRVGDETITHVGRADVQPNGRIDVHYIVDLQTNYLPPGLTIHSQWRLQDQTGAQGITGWADLDLTDPRFRWHQKTSGPIQLNWHDVDDQYANTVLDAATKAYSPAGQAPAATAPLIRVFIYGRDVDFRAALGVGSENWVGGQTFPSYRIVLLLISPTDVAAAQRSIAHEMTHLRLDAADTGTSAPLPSWLDEGIAVMGEGATQPAFSQALDLAAREHRLFSLQSLSGNFPESPTDAIVAYAESESIVRFFITTYGSDKLTAFIAGLRAGQSTDDAMTQTTGVTAHDFQVAWQASLGATSQPPSAAQAPTAPQTPAAPAGSPIVRAVNGALRALTALVDSLINLIQSPKPKPA